MVFYHSWPLWAIGGVIKAMAHKACGKAFFEALDFPTFIELLL